MAEIHLLNAGFFRLDGGAIFGTVPKVLWEKLCVPDEKNRLRQASRVMLIIDGERKILVDMGMGNWHAPDFVDRYGIEEPDFDFNSGLATLKLTTDDITDVIVTHLHFDHSGGLVCKQGREIGLTFSNASIWVQKRHWQWAQNPCRKDRGNFLDTYINIIGDSGKLELVDGPAQISENVSVLDFDGHSPGMQTAVAESGGKTYWFPSDLIPTVWHLRIPYLMAYDNNPVLAAEEKETMLEKVRSEKWTICFCHDTDHETGGEELIDKITAE
jgi:glyoxylase-like metal-dependent hydrolase (beta-lactamase superfamily II)